MAGGWAGGEEVNEFLQEVLRRSQHLCAGEGRRAEKTTVLGEGEKTSLEDLFHLCFLQRPRRLGRDRLLKEAEQKSDLHWRKFNLEQAVANQFKLIKGFSSDSGRKACVGSSIIPQLK